MERQETEGSTTPDCKRSTLLTANTARREHCQQRHVAELSVLLRFHPFSLSA